MARLHKEYIDYNGKLKLTESRKKDLRKSRKAIRDKIRNWFKENKSNELQPKFKIQGSFEHNTNNNPIVETNSDGEKLRKYDLDDGIYFIEKTDENNKRTR